MIEGITINDDSGYFTIAEIGHNRQGSVEKSQTGKRREAKHCDKCAGFPFEIKDSNDYTKSSMGRRNGALLMSIAWTHKGHPS